jgi:hypothetical protein
MDKSADALLGALIAERRILLGITIRRGPAARVADEDLNSFGAHVIGVAQSARA